MVNDPAPQPEPRQPFFNRQPAVVVWLAGAIVAAHLWRLFIASPEMSEEVANRLAVVPLNYEEGLNADNLLALVGHAFVHHDQLWFHVAFNVVLLLAVSGPVVRRLGANGGGALRYLALFVGSAIGGAAFYIMFNRGSDGGAIGASGAVCGLFAAFLMGVRWDWRASLRDPRVLSMGFWFLALNVGLAFVISQLGVLPIAWEAHLGGFVAGAILFPFLAPKYAGR